MTIAFVFPGQGSQQVGMMEGFAEHPAVRATFAEASEVLGDDLWALVQNGPADALNLTRNTQPVMLTAGVAVWRAWQAIAGASPVVRGRAQSRRVHGAGRSRCARISRRGAARAFSRRGDAGSGPAGGRRDGRGDRSRRRRGRRRVPRGGARRSGRAGQLQRAGTDRDRRTTGAPSSARSSLRRRAARSARCCCRYRRRFTARC